MRWFRAKRVGSSARAAIKRRNTRLFVEQFETRRLLSATNILTYLNDLSGTGANTNETALTPLNVNAATFGKAFTSTVDGQVYAQPLYMANVNITTGANQGIHNVVFVATAHDSLYAFNADNGALLWHTSFIANTAPGVLDVNPNINSNTVVTTVPSGDVNSTDISPEIGIIATPVIDSTTNTIYLTAKTKDVVNGKTNAPDYVYQLYAVNISNGRLQTSIGGGVMQFGDTVFTNNNYTNNTAIAVRATTSSAVGQAGGVIKFNTLRALDRSGLTLANGQIYLAFASHGDNGPYHGWVTSFKASSLQLTGVFNSTPGDTEGGTWQSGGKIEVDSAGALYFETGNGGFDTTLDANGFPVNGDYGDAVVKMVVDPTTTAANPGKNGWGLKVTDYFAPFNQSKLNNNDTDLAASGLVLLPDSLGTAAHPHLLIARGKSGVVYLLDRDHLGKFNTTTDHVVQEFSDSGGYWSSPTYFNGAFYGTPNGGNLHQWAIASASFSTSVLHTGPDTFGFPGATGFISANGIANGIVWEVDKKTNQLRAYSAANVSNELYTTGVNSIRDALGTAVKFSVPIVDNGRVYVGTGNSLVVYGILNPPTTAPTAPTNLAAVGISTSQVRLTWTRNSTNESGFYVERSTDNVNFTQVGLADAGATTFIDSNGLRPSTTYYYRIRAYNAIGNSSYSNSTGAETLLGIAGLWADRDIGAPNATGGASFADNSFTVSGSGNDIFNTSDNFHYVYQPLAGNGTIIAQVLSQGNTSATAKAGVMIRESLNANSAFADVVATPGGGVLFQVRTATGASALAVASVSGAAPEWVMLVRAGNVITGYASSDGQNYTKIGSATFSMAANVFVGLAVNSNHDGTLSAATFGNVLVLPPQTYASDLSFTSATNGSGAVQKDKSQQGNTITLGGTAYSKGLGVRANSDVIYDINGQYTTFISDIGLDAEVGNSGAADFQVYGDGNLLYDSGLLTGGGTIGHIVVNVAGVNSLDLRVTDGASGGPNDDADWAGARLINGLPAAPSNLTGSIASGSQINLTWTDNSFNENAFEILREDPNTSTFDLVGTVAANVTSFVDAGLQNGQSYSYQLLATNTVGDSAVSNQATISIPAVPADPINLQLAQLTTTTVSLVWNIPPTNDTGVNIYRRDTTTSAFPLIASLPADTTSYTDTGLMPGTEHEYSIQTFNLGGFSGPANIEVTLLTLAPTGLTAVSGFGSMQLNWAASIGADTYNIYRSTSPGGEGAIPIATGVTTNSFQDTGLTGGTTYYYRVSAVNDGGESALSTETHAVYVAPPTLGAGPYSLWSTSTIPTWLDNPDSSSVELGMKFRANNNGYISGIRFYKSTNNTGTHVADLWTTTGTLLATATFSGETASGWQTVNFAQPVAITAGTVYIASYHTNTGHYSDSIGYFSSGLTNGPLQALADGVSGPNGVFAYGPAGNFPTNTYHASNYWVDVLLTSLVNSVTPNNGASGVAVNASATVRFNAPMNSATLNVNTLTLQDNSGNSVAINISYDATSMTATLAPQSSLVKGRTYIVTVKGGANGVADQNGDTLTGNFTSSFATVLPPIALAPGPFSIWPNTTAPGVVDNPDPQAVELGVKFRAAGDGFITGIRFYKGAKNTGTHVGNLWAADGTLLATATFSGESASGWQTVSFSQPVAIKAGTTYIASYHTNVGNYSDDIGFYSKGAVTSGPLTALANGADGPNGVYQYGASSGFPANTYNGSNYWVDVVLTSLVNSVTPSNKATGVATNAAVQIRFNTAMNTSTLNTSTLLLRNAANTPIAVSIAYDSNSRIATLTPSAPLANGATYAVIVKGSAAGILDTVGDAMAADFTSTFTTAVAVGPQTVSIFGTSAVPFWIDNPDNQPVELGMKFRSDLDGFITGMRFYKSANNVGQHVANLWGPDGTLLGSGTFVNETASGWQTITFAQPIAITANTTYIASYHTNSGHYSDNIGYFSAGSVTTGPLHALGDGIDGPDGVFHYGAASALPSDTYHASNYWVDVLFTTQM